MDFRKLYKENPNYQNRIQKNKDILSEKRRSKRLQNFNNNRKDLDKILSDDNEVEKKLKDRRVLLLQWKEKKLKEKKNKEEKKIKPFVVGVIRHNIGSPLFKDISNIGKRTNIREKLKDAQPKQNPLVKEFPFKSSAESQFKFKVHPSVKKLTIPQSPNFSSAKKNKPNEKKFKFESKILGENVNDRKENADQKKMILRKRTCRVRLIEDKSEEVSADVVTNVASCESLSLKAATVVTTTDVPADDCHINCNPSGSHEEVNINPVEALTSDTSNEDKLHLNSQIEVSPEVISLRTPPSKESELEKGENFVISPFVTIVRGKERRGMIFRPEDSAKKEDVRRLSGSLSAFSAQELEQEEKSESEPYYLKLDKESKRIIELCDDWSKLVLTHNNIPKDILDEIDSVVGQSRLLVKDKFQQFRSLVDRFECKVEPPVTINDLDGFWDMMYIQVEGMNVRFMKLESLKQNKWMPLVSDKPPKSSGNVHTKKNVKGKGTKPVSKVSGNFRKFLKEMKNKDASSDRPSSPGVNPSDLDLPLTTSSSPGGKFGTPRKSATSGGLLKKVLSSSVHEKLNTSTDSAHRVLRMSFIGKELGTSPIKLVDESCSSPSNKSILRKSPVCNDSKIKKKVLFTSCVAFANDDSIDDVNNTTFSIENDINEHDQPGPSCHSFLIAKKQSVKITSDSEESTNLSTSEVSLENTAVNISRKRSAATSDASFTPRRSVRLIHKSALATPSPEPLQRTKSTRKKGSGTPHPKKKSLN